MVLAVSDRAISDYQMLEMTRCMFKAQWDFRSTAGDTDIPHIEWLSKVKFV